MMRFFLYVLAGLAFAGPVLFWAYVSAMACAFVTSSTGCSVTISDFWDSEFLAIAALPWMLCVVCILIARRIDKRDE